MPRLLRINVPEYVYYIIARGNHREDIFETLNDREVLNEMVKKFTRQHRSRVHGYCWMTNHIHLILQLGNKKSSTTAQVMQPIMMRYSRYRHIQLGTTGHYFEKRHIAKVVDKDNQLPTLIRYVHI